MTKAVAHPTFWRTVLVLLVAARRRSRGRWIQQRRLFAQRAGAESFNYGGLATVISIVFALVLHAGAAYVAVQTVALGQRAAAEQAGRIVVSDAFIGYLQDTLRTAKADADIDDRLERAIVRQAVHRSEVDDSSEPAQEQVIRRAIKKRDIAAFVSNEEAAPGLAQPATTGLPALLASLALFIWSTMLVLKREGWELDVQRRRHPMWEWLFSHPVSPAAVFLAEMLAPIAASPLYWTAPLFPGLVYGWLYGLGPGCAAAVLIGVPIATAAACLGKALEAVVLLRTSVRSGGALIGLMSWLGFSSSMVIFLLLFMIGRAVSAIAPPLAPFADWPWPWFALFLGQSSGASSFAAGVLANLAISGAVIAGSVWIAVWAAGAGLVGRTGTRDTAPARPRGKLRFGSNPLYRKELTWFVRDRSALVQAVLVPLTLAAFQLFNFRGLFEASTGDWTRLAGGAVIFGTYFLVTLGPKSLTSEGATLWLALTWPISLENLLKAKARLWALLSTCVVGLALAYAAWLYPGSIPGIALVGAGWLVFARSMAEKAVTLATVTTESGETKGGSPNRQWAVMLGTLSFAVGVMTRQWPLAVIGIVYSWATAAAMWQNFRARLPFLLDPWSEKLPPAPTLMHAMIAISALVDGGALLTGITVSAFGRDSAAIAFPLSYGVAAAAVSLTAAQMLSNRGCDARDVWLWRRGDALTPALGAALAAVGLGLALGLLGVLYLAILRHLPWLAHIVQMPDAARTDNTDLQRAIFAAAVLIAPPAEEYLFRGLLYRALDREWGGWPAVFGSALFFASYHPVLAWLPVGLLGVANALLFKRTGRLLPAVLTHMVYNAVVVGWQIWSAT